MGKSGLFSKEHLSAENKKDNKVVSYGKLRKFRINNKIQKIHKTNVFYAIKNKNLIKNQ